MGFNTTVLLYNDQTDRWPKEIWHATAGWKRHELRRHRFAGNEDGRFGYGQVIACEHADHDQVCVVGQNWGRYLTQVSPPERAGDLTILADLLRAHGYSVRAPGEKRSEGPLRWGYWADQRRLEQNGDAAGTQP